MLASSLSLFGAVSHRTLGSPGLKQQPQSSLCALSSKHLCFFKVQSCAKKLLVSGIMKFELLNDTSPLLMMFLPLFDGYLEDQPT